MVLSLLFSPQTSNFQPQTSPSLFTTLFGTAQLALQDALRNNLDAAGSTPRAPNFLVVSLRRENFLREHRDDLQREVEHFRRDLEGAMRDYLASHGWSIGGSGTVVMNLLVIEMAEECTVEARIARSLYELAIEDDRGNRVVPIGSNPTTIGRAHEPHPRGFVPVYDSLRLFSREHVLLTYRDLTLHVRLLGRNPTTINGRPLGAEDVEVVQGDAIVCGNCELKIGELLKG